jgi:hypothetical protein
MAGDRSTLGSSDGRRRQVGLSTMLRNDKTDAAESRRPQTPRERSGSDDRPQLKTIQSSRGKTKELASRVSTIAAQSYHGASSSLHGLLNRGRSPSGRLNSATRSRDASRSRTPSTDLRHKRSQTLPQIFGSHSTPHLPLTSVTETDLQNPSQRTQGWVNVSESTAKKGVPRKEAWKAHIGSISNNSLFLYRPHGLGYRYFQPSSLDGHASSVNDSRLSWDKLSHKTKDRHPGLVLDKNSKVLRGTPESICHEIMFTEDMHFVKYAIQSLPAWAEPSSAMTYFGLYSTLQDSTLRTAVVMQVIAKNLSGLFLDNNFVQALHPMIDRIGIHQPSRIPKADTDKLHSKIDSAIQRMKIVQSRAVNTVEEPISSRSSVSTTLTISTDDLLEIDPKTLADQIAQFHMHYQVEWSPETDFSQMMQSTRVNLPANPLVFTDRRIHFLTKLILHHILSGDDKNNNRHKRAAVITRWIDVGKHVQELGDMVGWIAIVFGITSPAVIRLRDTWELIHSKQRTTVATLWETVSLDLQRRKIQVVHHKKRPHVIVPQGAGSWQFRSDVIPYLGDLCYIFEDIRSNEDTIVNISLYEQGLEVMKNSLSRWESWVSANPRGSLDPDPSPRRIILSLQRRLYALNSLHRDAVSLEATEFYDLSLEREPAPLGHYLQAHYSTTWPLQPGNSSAMVYTQVLPQYALFDEKDTETNKSLPPSSGHTEMRSQTTLNPPDPAAELKRRSLRRTRSFPPSRGGPITGDLKLDFQTHNAAAGLRGGREGILKAIRDVTGVSVVTFSTADDELIFKSLNESETNNRTSILIEQENKRLSAQLSGSLTPTTTEFDPTNRASFIGSLSPLKTDDMTVVVKGGTLERLVDILVLGFQNFQDKVTSSRFGLGVSKNSEMDMNVYLPTFFATFRSFCSPIVLIEYLHKRLVGAKSAARTFQRFDAEDIVFPDWSHVEDVDFEQVDWPLVLEIHTGIVRALLHWVNQYFEDFNQDPALREQLGSIIVAAEHEMEQWKLLIADKRRASSKIMQQNVRHFGEMLGGLQTQFSLKSFHPPDVINSKARSDTPVLEFNLSKRFSDLENFLVDVNALAMFHVKKVGISDWMSAFEILEKQGSEVLGFFTTKPAALVPDDEIFVQNVFSYFHRTNVTASGLSIFAAFPRRIRELIQFHEELSQWFLDQIIAPHLSLEERSTIVGRLLQLLSLCQANMSQWALYSNPQKSSSSVASFVGIALATAFVHPDSRIMTHSWSLAIAKTSQHKGQVDNLVQILPTLSQDLPRRQLSLAPSISWLFERMLEIICFIPNMLIENSRLINFDKRRYVYNLVTNVVDLSEVEDARAMPFTLPPRTRFERSKLKAVVASENEGLRGNRPKLFWKLLADEAEKVRRDGRQRETINRQMRESTKSSQRRGPALRALFKSVRPLSMSVSSSTSVLEPPTIPSSELPNIERIEWGKAVTVLKLANIEILHTGIASDPNILQLRGRYKSTIYYLQFPDTESTNLWAKALEDASKAFFVESSSSTLKQVRSSVQPMFGIGLDEMAARDGVPVPEEVIRWNQIVETRGSQEVGIYRVSASRATLKQLRACYDAGELPDFDSEIWLDVNIFTGIMKDFLRELPDPLISPEAVQAAYLGLVAPEEVIDKVSILNTALSSTTPASVAFLEHYLSHLHRVSQFAYVTRMGTSNLSLVCGLSLSHNPGINQVLARAFIENAPSLFPQSVTSPSQSPLPHTIPLPLSRSQSQAATPMARSRSQSQAPTPALGSGPFFTFNSASTSTAIPTELAVQQPQEHRLLPSADVLSQSSTLVMSDSELVIQGDLIGLILADPNSHLHERSRNNSHN